jgi:hypothetical protein
VVEGLSTVTDDHHRVDQVEVCACQAKYHQAVMEDSAREVSEHPDRRNCVPLQTVNVRPGQAREIRVQLEGR